ncbi:MAG: hypothetical protein JGK17_26710 [Microcoleus sp. PH2017_10_PVI_O_A]|uniref:hypothetical protein n=1 Tax=unclassified Microcoleus TaxID=2642155 RepID=UPI001E0F9054|nr:MULTISPECIES: hypothetical protein [unclassified Microcoleus]MCC3463215.1 hypothetical protein [Microcoleus sp. PH2017_11_PCY_U_A]MCC3409097.1 hypothetical protein [Microcoleus sp. PH2017_10_PVI_O_A]MCC3481635.1 hypothetical protein [Microcoleus sp. PH2017_12_PCY_D_A]MCC3528631.1 hypothetical protein [Microcoleus sp. PH2017_21_RUC_O_A]MCC3540886.1 hypothetical protein [Microcoleus sp. PH2017_22_RUC_O_B]
MTVVAVVAVAVAVVAVAAVAAVVAVAVVVDINGTYATIKETGFLANLWVIAKYFGKNPVSGYPLIY